MNWQVFIAGNKGAGKSTLLKTLVFLNMNPRRLFLVWDSMLEWEETENTIILRPPDWTGEDVAALAWEMRDVTLVIDEIDLVAPNHAGGLQTGSALNKVIQYGRHRNVALIAAARRSARCHTDVRSQADTFYLLSHHEPNDLAWISKFCGKDTAQAVLELPRHEFILVRF